MVVLESAAVEPALPSPWVLGDCAPSRGYCLTQSTCISDCCTVPPLGNQSSWMHRCIGPGGCTARSVVPYHFRPSRKVVTAVGVHSTAQLCHRVASTCTCPCS